MSDSKNNIPKPGSPVDLVPFGRMLYWTGSDRLTIEHHEAKREGDFWVPVDVPEQNGPHIGVDWDDPKRFSKVIVRYADKTAPEQGQVKLQYWRHNWPERWSGGWTALDDPFNGGWITAHGDVEINGDTWTHTFDPLDITELGSANDHAVTYRQALKVRLLFKGVSPKIKSLEVHSLASWKEVALRMDFSGGLSYDKNIQASEGYITSVDDSNPKSVRMKVLYADGSPMDKTVLTVSGKPRNFSLMPADAVLHGVYIPDFGVFIGAEGAGGLEAWKKNKPSDIPIYDRILTEPEQTFERSRKEIPELQKPKQGLYGRYCPIGCDANRQEFAVRYNAEIFCDKREMKSVGRDTAKLLWPGQSIFFKFPTGDPADFRYREDGTEQKPLNGYLPIYTSTWKDREFVYEMTSFAALLEESPWDEEKKRGDEPMVALSKIKIRNTTEEKRKIRFWIVIENPEELAVDNDGFIYATGRAREDDVPDAPIQKRWITEPYPVRRMRALLNTKGMGQAVPVSCSYAPFEVSSIPNAIAYDIELEPRTSHEIELFIPFITFTGDDGRKAVKALSYDAKHAEMAEYWQKQIDAGAKINVPDEMLNDFNRANVPHIAITADKDIDTGLYILGAGTWAYQVFGTETVDQCRSLDLRGYHDRARKYIMPFVELQGTRRMDGRFKTQEGTFHGVKVNDEFDYQVGDYSLDHGTILWMLGEHYKITRDAAWLKSIAENIIVACDYVTRERQATMRFEADGSKVWEYGLFPPAHLDDNPEWLFWYINNTLAYRGMKNAGEVLAEVGHKDAARIAKDAEAFGTDIKRSIALSIERSPVSRLADGTYVPHTPVRCRLRGPDVGWIREALYGPVHYVDCGLIDPNSDETTWIMKDYEDNIFTTRRQGRQIDLEKYWFSQGGITIQSNLLPNPLVYLSRGQVEHALRAFFNSCAANIYADVRCFTEHPVNAYGLGAGPFYKTPDEAAFITWFRHLLMMEQDDTLIVAPGTPREWLEDGKEIKFEDAPTYFGPMSYRIISEVSKGKIRVEMQPPKRNPSKKLEIKLRHPSKSPMKSVTLNGKPYSDFDPAREVISLPGDLPEKVEIIAGY